MFARYVDPTLPATLEGILAEPFVRLPYAEAVSILIASGKAFTYPVAFGTDLQSEHERYLTEEHFKKPVIVYDYPKDIKAFYMRQNDDGKTVAAMRPRMMRSWLDRSKTTTPESSSRMSVSASISPPERPRNNASTSS